MMASTVEILKHIIRRMFVDTKYIVIFGRTTTKEHLEGLTEDDFIIEEYDDKNKAIPREVQTIGSELLRRQLFPLTERYWKGVDEEIVNFNKTTNRRVNRGIPLGNIGVAQIAQERAVEGLFSIYRAYEDDRVCLEHLPGIVRDAEIEIANSRLYTQFENRLVSTLFTDLVSKFKHAFATDISQVDLSAFLSDLKPDKRLLLYVILHRFTSAHSLDRQLTTFISRGELLRAISHFAVWFEEEMKVHRSSPSEPLVPVLIRMMKGVELIPPNSSSGFLSASSLDELDGKIAAWSGGSDPLEIQNARIMARVRNFAGHNLEVQEHEFFQRCDEVFARMLSFIFYAKSQGWILN